MKKKSQNQINLEALILMASPEEIAHGETWYAVAHQFAKALAKRHKITRKQAAGVIAALSPNNKWERNLEDAETMCKQFRAGETIDSFKVCTYTPNKVNAWKILQGAEPDDVLKGLKTNSFFHNIFDPTANYVTIDGHAFNAWERGPKQGYQTLDKVKSISPAKYTAVSQDYIKAAEILNLKPCQAQAIVWVVWRRIGGVK